MSYTFLTNNLTNITPDQSDFGTGTYDDGDDSDARIWAAAELWQTTGEPAYQNDFETRANNLTDKVISDITWGNVQDLAMLTYLQSSRSGKSASLVAAIQSQLISTANTLVANDKNEAYGRPMGNSYYWGCNGTVADQVAILKAANAISPNADYIHASEDVLSYLFGRNYHSRSYVTGLGKNPPLNIHDRKSAAFGKGAWPGYLVGGPWPGPKDWDDDQSDYEHNEIAINWNAGLIYALASFIQ